MVRRALLAGWAGYMAGTLKMTLFSTLSGWTSRIWEAGKKALARFLPVLQILTQRLGAEI